MGIDSAELREQVQKTEEHKLAIVEKVQDLLADDLIADCPTEDLEYAIELMKLEWFRRRVLPQFPVGSPVMVFDKWYRIGVLKGFDLVYDKAVIVLELFTKDNKPYPYFVYNPNELMRVKPK